MTTTIKIKDKFVAQLEQNFQLHQGLDLYIFDTTLLDESMDDLKRLSAPRQKESDGGLEARLVYTLHSKNEDARKLVTHMVTEASRNMFTMADFLKSLEKGYKTSFKTAHGTMRLETKRDQVQTFIQIRNEIYSRSPDSKNLMFRYNPRNTRFSRAMGAVAASAIAVVALNYEGPVQPYQAAELILGSGISYPLLSLAVKYLLPLSMSGKSMILDIDGKLKKMESCSSELSRLNSDMKVNERSMTIKNYERLAKKAKKKSDELSDLTSQSCSMMKLLPDIYRSVCESEGLHLVYRSADKKVDALTDTMRSLVQIR